MNFVTSPFGLEYQSDEVQVFFGNQHTNLDFLNQHNSGLQIMRIKQIHSDIVIEANAQLIEADAHYTTVKSKALVIATADCLPILIFDRNLGLIASVHAGWKGVVQRILPKTLEVFKKKGSSLDNLFFFIGPHIQQNSFEVEEEVKNSLQKSICNKDRFLNFCLQKKVDDKLKYYIDLSAIIIEQINEMSCEKPLILLSTIDTKTDLNWYSYRRDQQSSGRNLSFIALRNCLKGPFILP